MINQHNHFNNATKLFQIFVSSEEEKDECNLCDMVIPEWGDFDV